MVKRIGQVRSTKRSGTKIRKRWRKEGRCYECGSEAANGEYRCAKCNERRNQRKKAKLEGKPAKKKYIPTDEPRERLELFLSPTTFADLEKQLTDFKRVFKEGAKYQQHMMALLRGLTITGLRLRGRPSQEEVTAVQDTRAERKAVEIECTKTEQRMLQAASADFAYDVRSMLGAIVERETSVRPKLPFVPKLDGLKGNVVLVKDNRTVKRMPEWLWTRNTPIIDGYISIRNVINLDENGEPIEPVVRNRRVTMRLSEDEYQGLERLRKTRAGGRLTRIPKRDALLRHAFFEWCDQKFFDLPERYDAYKKSMYENLDLRSKAEKETKQYKREIKRYKRENRNLRFALDWSLAGTAPMLENGLIMEARMMEIGFETPNDEVMDLAKKVRTTRQSIPKNKLALHYEVERYEQLEDLRKMTPKERKAWRRNRIEMIHSLAKKYERWLPMLDDLYRKQKEQEGLPPS